MMILQEAEAIYDAGKDTVVAVLLKLDARIDDLEKQVQDLTTRLDVSENRTRELENQIAKNSRNSSKPPSTDGFKKPSPKSLRKKGMRKTGGQAGHNGHTLKMVDNPDHTEVHTVEVCEKCNCLLADKPVDKVEKRQIFDLPPIKITVTEHQVETITCACGHVNKSDFPKGVNAPVQYGASVRSVAVYLKNYQFLPYKRTCELFQDLFGFPIGQGTLANIISECDDLAEAPVEKIKKQIQDAAVAHFDESGSRVEGKRWWLHSASTEAATYYGVHRKRGAEAIDEIGILPYFHGWAVHDFWIAYFAYHCLHSLCNAHHLRELVFVHEQHKQNWAENMITCLLNIKTTVDKVKQISKQLDKSQILRFEKQYQRVIDEGYETNPLPPVPKNKKKKPGRRKKTKPRNLIERLDKHRGEALAFMYDFRIPFDNNLAERDIRMIKVQQKISGTFRSEDGAKAFCRIRSYLSTARKNSIGAMDSLVLLYDGCPFIPTPINLMHDE